MEQGKIFKASVTTLESMVNKGFLNRNFVLLPDSDRHAWPGGVDATSREISRSFL